jgi:hypothetical protein
MDRKRSDIINARVLLEGDVLRMYRELRSRGLVKSTRDAFTQGISVLYEKVMERDLLEARAKTSAQMVE